MKSTLVKMSLLLLLLPLSILAQKNHGLSEEELKNWWQKDLEQDTIPGISLNRAYLELLQNKKGEEVIVAVLDTKIDVNHEDIKEQLWVNKDEIAGNGIDDDKNGYIDDINGWNFLGNSKGEDVVVQQSEATRIVKRYQDKYGTVEKEDVPTKEKDAYTLFIEAKNVRDADVSETWDNIKYLDSAVVEFVRIRDTVAQILAKKTFSIQEVDSLTEEHPDLKDGLNHLSQMMGYEVTEDTYKENVERLTAYLNTLYSIEYDERSSLGDDPHLLNDVPYGNNILINNELDFQHSTPVSGLMAATRDNGLGVDGISNNIRIMPVVMVAEGDEYDKEVALAIRYAVDNGADIINMSWGKYLSLHVGWVRDAFRYAASHDVLLVSASGNDSKNTDIELNYPNDHIDGVEFVDNFIMVGGSGYVIDSTLVASFSNYGKNTTDIFAPAVKIYAPHIENSYRYARGTSFASPLMAGVAALVKSYYPNLTAPEIKEIIMASGTPFNIPVRVYQDDDTTKLIPFSELSKSGKIINAYNALKMAEQRTKKDLDKVKRRE